MSVRAAIVDRFEGNEDAATVNLRAAVGDFAADIMHPSTQEPFIVVHVGERVPHPEKGRDKSGGGVEVSLAQVMCVATMVAEAEKIVDLIRASLEATQRHGDSCSLTIRNRTFLSIHWLGDEIGLNERFPDKATGTVSYNVLAYRDCEHSACSSSSSE